MFDFDVVTGPSPALADPSAPSKTDAHPPLPRTEAKAPGEGRPPRIAEGKAPTGSGRS